MGCSLIRCQRLFFFSSCSFSKKLLVLILVENVDGKNFFIWVHQRRDVLTIENKSIGPLALGCIIYTIVNDERNIERKIDYRISGCVLL